MRPEWDDGHRHCLGPACLQHSAERQIPLEDLASIGDGDRSMLSLLAHAEAAQASCFVDASEGTHGTMGFH